MIVDSGMSLSQSTTSKESTRDCTRDQNELWKIRVLYVCT